MIGQIHKKSWQRDGLAVSLLCALFALLAPGGARAFCGFYVTGADTSLYANATMVVLMRDGTRTVLSMQNNYQGPPDAFALVVPVPTVLTKDQVKTLPKEVFQHVDTLGAPRLVEYWESDPCTPPLEYDGVLNAASGGAADAGTRGSVTIEAQFAVGEYEVVILSADDSSALETWLKDNSYNIPSGAADVLQPYVAQGTKFFVAKVDTSKVKFDNGHAVLSPLRFYYDSPTFSLPVRLGLLNSNGSQDLLINILAQSRYEVANYPNVTVPTNIRVQNAVRDDFPGFYEALFSGLIDKNPGAVVTEYSWDSGSCDPCPTPPLTQEDLATFGADVTQGLGSTDAGVPPGGFGYVNYTLTRLHYRYTSGGLEDDIVFKQADALMGGRGIPDADGSLDQSVQTTAGGYNNFQGRYVILHPWTEALSCDAPVRGNWGGPNGSGGPMTQGASNVTLAMGAPPRAADLQTLLAEPVPALGVTMIGPGSNADKDAGATKDASTTATSSHGSSGICSVGKIGADHRGSAGAFFAGLGLMLLAARRRRKAEHTQ